MPKNILDRVLATVEKHAETTNARLDLRIVDHKRIASSYNQSKLMIQYDPLRPAPTLGELEQWFGYKFANKAHIVRDSAVRYHNEPSLTVVASLTQLTRPLADAEQMHNYTLGAYADMQTGTLWDVQDLEDGTRYLVARSTENLDELFQKHRQRPVDRRVASTLDQLERTASRVYNVGDTVKFVDGDTVLIGEVSSCNGSTCTVKANGGSRSIDCSQITDVVRRAPQNVNEERNEADNYYTKAFGDKAYADALTSTMTKDVATNHNPAASGVKRV